MIQKTFNGKTFQHKVTVDEHHVIYMTQDVYSFYLSRQQFVKRGTHKLSKKVVEKDVENLLDEFNILDDYKELYLSTEEDGAWLSTFITVYGEVITCK